MGITFRNRVDKTEINTIDEMGIDEMGKCRRNGNYPQKWSRQNENKTSRRNVNRENGKLPFPGWRLFGELLPHRLK